VLFTDYISVGAVITSHCRLAGKAIEPLRAITAVQERKTCPCRPNVPPAVSRISKSTECENGVDALRM
jgi:hypothetical protein